MYRALYCLTEEHTAEAMPLAILVCGISCYLALWLLRQARQIGRSAPRLWLAGAGTVAGIGIWCTHFIGMLGYDPGLGVGYSLPLVLSSLGAAAATGCLTLLLLQRWWHLTGAIFAGLIFGLGAAAAHLVGMAGVQMPGVFIWHTLLLATALLVGCTFAALALMASVRPITRYPNLLSTSLLTVAIAGLHFLSMAGAEAVPDPSLEPMIESLPRSTLALALAGAMVAVLAFLVLAMFTEHLRRTNVIMRERKRLLREKTSLLDAVLENMDQGLMMVDAHGIVQIYNGRAIELLNLPAPMMSAQPAFEAVRQYQISQLHFTGSVDDVLEHVAENVLDLEAPASECVRPDGTVLEIRTVPLADGGAVQTYTDTTARKRAEMRLVESEARLALALDAGSDGLWDCDFDTGAAWSSDRWWQVLGYEPGELEEHARTWRALIHPEDVLMADRILDEHLKGHTAIYECEHRLRRKDGTWAWMLTRGRVVARDEGGKPQRFVGTQTDIGARKAAESRIVHMARHDALTDLPNRVLFHERLSQKFAEISDQGGSCAVLCIDLDRFKNINDNLGHLAGDALLCAIAQRLRTHLGPDDTVARLGGDEFAILISSTGERNAVAQIAERLIGSLQEPVRFGEQIMEVGMSVGVALAPAHGTSGEEVFKRADLALYRAKAEGRNTYRLFEFAMDVAAAERRGLERDLRRAIESGELTIHYQPQVNTASGVLTGFEALVRWVHPDRGLISPASFIPLAEESGLIIPLGEWVLRTACREAAQWGSDLKIAVNLSPRQFLQADLADRVLAIVAETGLSPMRLELEITESVIINDLAHALGILRHLKALGIRFAMDDFGTGYSSLATLQAFPFDKIKIDRSFVGQVEDSAQSAAIVRAVIGLGRSLGMGVVAEGVENEAQLRFLAQEGCEEVQGYLLGKPQPIERFREAIRSRELEAPRLQDLSHAA